MADIQVDVGVIYQKSCSSTHISLYFLKFRMKIFMIEIFFHPLILNLKKKKKHMERPWQWISYRQLSLIFLLTLFYFLLMNICHSVLLLRRFKFLCMNIYFPVILIFLFFFFFFGDNCHIDLEVIDMYSPLSLTPFLLFVRLCDSLYEPI